jgi:hypothetical protein
MRTSQVWPRAASDGNPLFNTAPAGTGVETQVRPPSDDSRGSSGHGTEFVDVDAGQPDFTIQMDRPRASTAKTVPNWVLAVQFLPLSWLTKSPGP